MPGNVGFRGVESKFMDDENDSYIRRVNGEYVDRRLLSRGRRRITKTRGQDCEIDQDCLNGESCIRERDRERERERER